MGFTKRIFAFSIYLDSISPIAIVPLVTVKDGKVFANSRDVAEYFGKLHKNVLRDIYNLDCSENFRALNFELTIETNIVGATRRHIRTFDMTKDGFAFLVMGFTCAEAGRFKEAYIAAFNEMEAKLKSSTPALPNFADPAAAAIAWAEEYRAHALNFEGVIKTFHVQLTDKGAAKVLTDAILRWMLHVRPILDLH